MMASLLWLLIGYHCIVTSCFPWWWVDEPRLSQVIGPLTVRLEPPVFTGSIQLKMQNSYLVASWNSGAFAKNDLDTGFISGYYYAVGMYISIMQVTRQFNYMFSGSLVLAKTVSICV